jgi:LytR cell envelope-related transcriptional attenuator
MASLPFALSVHHFISSVGADAGFASLIGLALLILLYFAHARETATLRSRADEAGFRVQELETQLADLADQVAALPAEISVRATGPRVAAAQAGIAQRAVAGVGADRADGLPFPPAAPAGMAAPALAAATRLIPMPELPIEEPEPATVHGGAPNGTTPVPVAASAGTMQRPVPVPAPVGPRPRQPAEPGRTAGAGGYPNRPNGGQSRPTSGQRRVGGQPNSGAARPAMPVRPRPKRSRTGRTILAVLVALIGAAAVVVAVLVLSKGSGSHKPKSSSASSLTSHRTLPKGTVIVRPSDVTVSVLNGTDQNGLAAAVMGKLSTEGFRKGAVTNATNQTLTTSVVAYAAPANRTDALAVAQYLKLSAKTVQAVNPGTKQVACSASPVGCTSLVYVTVGSDLSAQ